MEFLYESQRIYVKDASGKMIVEATFPLIKEGVGNVDHTYVDPSLRGQGIANTLMHKVYEYAKERGLKLVATCPYAIVWFKKHQEQNDVLDEEMQATLAPECKII